MKRLTRKDIDRKAIAKKLAEEAKALAEFRAMDEDELVCCLTDAINSAGCANGYEIAKELDRQGVCCPDSQVVEMLDSADVIETLLLDDVVKKWVAWENITPKLHIGSTAKVEYRGKGKVVGEITRIDHERATYTVFIESLGHVREGVGTHGICLPYEECEEAA